MKTGANLLYYKQRRVSFVIYITGDMHGEISRLRSRAARQLKKNDYLIVCGDFGFIWEDSAREKRLLSWLGKRKYHILFVEGTHDNLELINSYPEAEWNGGKVHEISGRLKHLVRGSVFELEGKKIFAFGGGESDDTELRVEDGRWWRDELPTPEVVEDARRNLARHENKVDYIVTHQTGFKLKRFLSMAHNDFNVLDVFFDEIREKCGYSRWFFGAYHINKVIPPADMAVFSAIQAAGQGKTAMAEAGKNRQ